jgi:hypothetical protein
MKVHSRSLAATLVAVAMVAAGSTPVRAAQDGSAPALKPSARAGLSYFDYTAAAGQVIRDAMVMVNVSASPATYRVYAVDSYTSPLSGIVYQDRTAPVSQVGTWISLSTGSVSLRSGESQTVPFTVDVPAGTRPGDYVAAVAGDNVTPSMRQGSGSGVTLNVTQRAALAVVIHVPGPGHIGFTLGEPSLHTENGTRQVIDIPMRNTSNVLLRPTMSLGVRSCTGQTVFEDPGRQLDTFTTGGSITYPYYLDSRVLAAGCYRVHIAVGKGAAGLDERTSTLLVSPQQADVKPPGTQTVPATVSGVAPGSSGMTLPWWLFLTGLAAGLAVPTLIFALVRARRRRRGAAEARS